MPRPKGSKNKKRLKRSVRLKLPDSTIDILNRLSEDSGLPFLKVLDDSALEGASELRTETYKGLIEFNKRRGKVIHERELFDHEEKHQEHETESAGDTNPVSDQARHDDAAFERGHEATAGEDTGVATENERSFSLSDFNVPLTDESETVG